MSSISLGIVIIVVSDSRKTTDRQESPRRSY